MEPTGQEEERKAEELLVVLPHSRHKGSRVQLGRDREDDQRSQTLEEEVGRSWSEIERMAQDWRRWSRK